jgi:hypothetical protein
MFAQCHMQNLENSDLFVRFEQKTCDSVAVDAEIGGPRGNVPPSLLRERDSVSGYSS